MKSFEIEDKAGFVRKLLSDDFFGKMYLYHADVKNSAYIEIDGRLNKEFFDNDAEELLNNQHYVTWEGMSGLFFQAIRGTRLPIRFSISLIMNEDDTANMITESGCSVALSDIESLNINIMYDKEKLTITSGNSYKIFTLDRSLDRYWDEFVQNSFKKLDIA